MPATSDNAIHRSTPTVTVIDNRGLVARTISYHRHPDTPALTQPRITRHQHDARGFKVASSDPRLHAAGRVNFRWLNDLSGHPLRTQSADTGVSINFVDAAGRPLLALTRVALNDDDSLDRRQAVSRRWHYEGAGLPGRPLGVSEQITGEPERRLERRVYAGSSSAEKGSNLAGQPYLLYDPAGLLHTRGISLAGVPMSTTRHLLAEVDDVQVTADWQDDLVEHWNSRLQPEPDGFTSETRVDATGEVLTTQDAAGHRQRRAYDVAGLLKASWLTLEGGREQVILKALSYSAAGQKLREEHGNGLVTTYQYEPRTQRLAAMRTERPTGHALGARRLQDLRYAYDPVGNVLSVRNDAEQTRFWRNQKIVPENIFTYDSLYQLASASGREMANAGRQAANLPVLARLDDVTYTRYSRTYSYDAGGNLTRIRHSAPASNNNYSIDITVSDRSNRTLADTLARAPGEVDALFTASGEQTSLAPGQLLCWTPRGELLKVSPVVREGQADDGEHYRYDSASQRIVKVSQQQTASTQHTQRVCYLPGVELRTKHHGATLVEDLHAVTVGEAGRAQVRALHWLIGKPEQLGNDALRYSFDDHLGSAALETDGSGAVISREEYYPYGGTSVWAADSEVQGRYKTVRYSGKERDATGLYYYGYRYYQPWLGRWLSADPAGSVDGLNLYAMVRNNPMTQVDEQGLMLRSMLGSLGLGPREEPSSGDSRQAAQASASPPSSPEPERSVGIAPVASPSATAASDTGMDDSARPSTNSKNQKRNAARKRKAQEDKAAKALELEQEKIREERRAQRTRQQEQRGAIQAVREFGTLSHDWSVYDRLQSRLPMNRQASGDSILAIGQRPDATSGKSEVVFLERGISKEGFKHITEEHRADFKEVGVSTDKQIIELIMTALVSGKIVGIQGKTTRQVGRPIYEVLFNGNKLNVAIQLKDDNSVLGANPKRFVSKKEQEALLPAPMRR